MRLSAGDAVLADTGDTGPSPEVARLARDADLLIAEATYPREVPEDSRAYLTDALTAARQATTADAKTLMLTHFWPGTDPALPLAVAAGEFAGPIYAASRKTLDLTYISEG